MRKSIPGAAMAARSLNSSAADNDAPRPFLSSMSIRLVWPFVQLTPPQQRDELVTRLQTTLGVDEKAFHDPDTRVSTQAVLDLFDGPMELLKLPNLGLLAADQVTAEHVGIGEYVARSSATLGDALRSYDRYLRLLCDGAHQSLDVHGDRAYARFWFDSSLPANAGVYEFALAVRLNVARRISGMPALAPLEVHFRHPAPRDITMHQQVFNCALHFNMPFTQLVLSSDTLAIQPVNSDPALSRLLGGLADKLLRQLPRSDNLVARVRAMLISEIELRDTSATQLAKRLGMSTRTLKRRLGEEGTSCRELIDERRRNGALCDLAQTLRPISEIALHLGFSTSQSFHRAFRRWTGETASTFRDRSRRRGAVH